MFHASLRTSLASALVGIAIYTPAQAQRRAGGSASLVVRTAVAPICTVSVRRTTEAPSSGVHFNCRNYSGTATPRVTQETQEAENIENATDAAASQQSVGSAGAPASSADAGMVDDDRPQTRVVVINF